MPWKAIKATAFYTFREQPLQKPTFNEYLIVTVINWYRYSN